MRYRLFACLVVLASAAQAAIVDKLPQARSESWDACRDTSKFAAVAACSDLINGIVPLGNPDLAEAYYHRGSAYFRNSDPMSALRDLDRALTLDPTIITAYVIRGAARAQTGDLDQAIVDFTTALMAKPDDPLVLVDRARTFAAKGDIGRANADVTKAIALDPMFAFAIAVRGALSEVLGHDDGGAGRLQRRAGHRPDAQHRPSGPRAAFIAVAPPHKQKRRPERAAFRFDHWKRRFRRTRA